MATLQFTFTAGSEAGALIRRMAEFSARRRPTYRIEIRPEPVSC